MNEFKRFSKLLKPEKTSLLIIDIQERILPVINNFRIVLDNTIKLIKGFKVLGLPIYFNKMSFSCSGADELFDDFKKKNLSQIVVCGIESHVCVQQTVLDLIENNFQVNLAADAVSSRKEFDYKTALERMNHHGAEVTTTEAILFELLNVCGTDQFRAISKIVK
jgi:nicotinamidase-related amidase